jgi:iron complex outermembrane receptor protein
LVENTLTYTYAEGDHNFTLLAGHSYQETKFEQKMFELDGFADNGIEPRYQDQISTEVLPTTVNSVAFVNEQQSFFGRVNYAYMDKYLVTATMRADGSSKFGANNKYGYFPSVALGWNIIREDFMADNTLFSNLKLRASWGQTGNQDGIPSKVSLASYVDSKVENDTYPLNGTEVTLDDYLLALFRFVQLIPILNGKFPHKPILVWILACSTEVLQVPWIISTRLPVMWCCFPTG